MTENPYTYHDPVEFVVDPDTTLREAQEIARVLIEAQELTIEAADEEGEENR